MLYDYVIFLSRVKASYFNDRGGTLDPDSFFLSFLHLSLLGRGGGGTDKVGALSVLYQFFTDSICLPNAGTARTWQPHSFYYIIFPTPVFTLMVTLETFLVSKKNLNLVSNQWHFHHWKRAELHLFFEGSLYTCSSEYVQHKMLSSNINRGWLR